LRANFNHQLQFLTQLEAS